MKKILILLALTISAAVFADQNVVRSPVSYTCSSDIQSILGTDGTAKACWPYFCHSSGDVYATAVCYTFCNSSDQCQSGTVCDTGTSKCVSTH